MNMIEKWIDALKKQMDPTTLVSCVIDLGRMLEAEGADPSQSHLVIYSDHRNMIHSEVKELYCERVNLDVSLFPYTVSVVAEIWFTFWALGEAEREFVAQAVDELIAARIEGVSNE